MKKFFILSLIFLAILLVFTSCGNKDSVPSENQIKEDLLGYTNNRGENTFASIEHLKIIDTLNQKSTVGGLMFTVYIEFTGEDGETYKFENYNVFYSWTDNDGWRLTQP